MKLGGTFAHSFLASCRSRLNRNLSWKMRKTLHQKKSKQTYCESTSTSNFSNQKLRQNISIKSQLAQGKISSEKSHRQTTEKKKFEGQWIYSRKTGHRKQECRSRLRDENSNTIKQDALRRNQSITRNLYANICRYTGLLAKDCCQRIPNETITPFGQVPYTKEDNTENRDRRRDLKKEQRPLNELECAMNSSTKDQSDKDQDFQ